MKVRLKFDPLTDHAKVSRVIKFNLRKYGFKGNADVLVAKALANGGWVTLEDNPKSKAQLGPGKFNPFPKADSEFPS